jgi:beta-lactamase regulating signal transducer with metallopeptidase domain
MMEALNRLSDQWFRWESAIFWQVAVLIAIVWLIDLTIRKWAWPQFRYAMWLLILVKLLLPPTLTSPVSVTSRMPATAGKFVQIIREGRINADSEAAGQTAAEPVTHHDAGPEDPARIELDASATASISKPANRGADAMPLLSPGLADGEKGIPAPVSPSAKEPALSMKAYAMMIWLSGVIALSTWLIIRLHNLRREHLKTEPQMRVPASFHEMLEETAGKLGLKRIPEVVLTDKVRCPAVFGAFRPVLLIPASKLPSLSKRDCEHILLHELAHIKRGDLLIHAAHMGLQIVFWFNPLLWLIRKPIQNLRELCCDATVSGILKESTYHYRETLINTARELLAEPADPGLGLIGLFENSNWLVHRLRWLEKKPWRNRRLKITAVIAMVLAMAAGVIPMANGKGKHSTSASPPGTPILSGIRPDASRTLYDLDGNATGQTLGLARWDQGLWGEESQRCDFIFEIPEGTMLSFPYIRVRPAGSKRRLGCGIGGGQVNHRGKKLFHFRMNLARQYQTNILEFDRRIDKLDLTLIYFPAAPKEIWRTDGPFTSGDSVEVGSDQTYTLKFLPNTAVSDDVAANFRIYSDGKIDDQIPLIAHDVKGHRHLAYYGNGGSDQTGTYQECLIKGIGLEHIQRIALAQPEFLEFRDVNLRMENKEVPAHAAHLDEMRTRLAPDQFTLKQLNDCTFSNAHQFAKVMDLLQGTQIWQALTNRYSSEDSFMSLTDLERERLRTALRKWSSARDADLRLVAIQRGLIELWPEFIEMALDEYENWHQLPKGKQDQKFRLLGPLSHRGKLFTKDQLLRLIALNDQEDYRSFKWTIQRIMREQTLLPFDPEEAERSFPDPEPSTSSNLDLIRQIMGETDPAWTVKLASGVRVRILGIGALPGGAERWHKPDGMALDKALYSTSFPRDHFQEMFPSVETAYQVLYAIERNSDYKELHHSQTLRATSSDSGDPLRCKLHYSRNLDDHVLRAVYMVAPHTTNKVDLSIPFERIGEDQPSDWANFRKIPLTRMAPP